MLARRIKGYYANDDYKTSFSWVDNVRKVKDDASIDALNTQLVQAVSERNPSIRITLPEIGAWDTILGFSFTRNKNAVRQVIDSADFIDNIPDLARLTIEVLKRDRLFVHDVVGIITEDTVYRCI